VSKVTELARAEADETEAAEEEETPTPEPTPEPEPEPEPTPEPAAVAAPVDEKKLERAVTTYFTAISKVLGEDMGGLTNCPHCAEYVPGFMPEDPPLELRQAPDKEACPLCEGLGMFLSGAKRGEFVNVSCTRCNGRGYIDKAMADTHNYATVSYMPPQPVDPYPGYGIAFVPVVGGSPDSEHRPAGHPHWGMPRDYSSALA